MKDASSDGRVWRDQFADVYDELLSIARARLRHEHANQTLQTTDLVHEAYRKLCGTDPPEWRGRAYFFAAASRAIRQVLVDQARRRNAERRGGGVRPMTLTSADLPANEVYDILTLDEALKLLEGLDEELAALVRLRYFGGLSESQCAKVLGISERQVRRRWAIARTTMERLLSADGEVE